MTLFIFGNYSYDKIKKEVFNIIFALKNKVNPNKKTKKKKHHQKTFKEYRDINKTIKYNVNNRISKKQITQNISRSPLMNPINKFIIVENNLKINISSILQKRDFELNLLNKRSNKIRS